MGAPFTILFGAYTFPNRTFEVVGLPIDTQLDESLMPRRDGSYILAQKLSPRRIRIRGILHGSDEATVEASLNEFIASLAVAGKQQLKYRSDRYLNAWMKSYGHSYAEGAYGQGTDFGGVANVDVQFQADDPYLYDIAATTHTQSLLSLTGSSAVFNIINTGLVPVVPVFRFVAGVTITNNILLHNRTNSHRFRWQGTLVPGMTLLIDAEAYTVELGNGVDGITQFDGDFMQLAAATNDMRYAGATLTLFDVVWRKRYLA